MIKQLLRVLMALCLNYKRIAKLILADNKVCYNILTLTITEETPDGKIFFPG